jgi:hypothetical protein
MFLAAASHFTNANELSWIQKSIIAPTSSSTLPEVSQSTGLAGVSVVARRTGALLHAADAGVWLRGEGLVGGQLGGGVQADVVQSGERVVEKVSDNIETTLLKGCKLLLLHFSSIAMLLFSLLGHDSRSSKLL